MKKYNATLKLEDVELATLERVFRESRDHDIVEIKLVGKSKAEAITRIRELLLSNHSKGVRVWFEGEGRCQDTTSS